MHAGERALSLNTRTKRKKNDRENVKINKMSENKKPPRLLSPQHGCHRHCCLLRMPGQSQRRQSRGRKKNFKIVEKWVNTHLMIVFVPLFFTHTHTNQSFFPTAFDCVFSPLLRSNRLEGGVKNEEGVESPFKGEGCSLTGMFFYDCPQRDSCC